MQPTTYEALDDNDDQIFYPAIKDGEDRYVFWDTKFDTHAEGEAFALGAILIIKNAIYSKLTAAGFYKLVKVPVADTLSDIGLGQ